MALAETNAIVGSQLKSNIRVPSPPGSAIVFGHADADGHLAAVQSREWLTQRGVKVTTVVSAETRNYQFWGRLQKFDLTPYNLIVIVDIAFRFRDPTESLERLLIVADQNQHKQFIVIDHHPFVHPEEHRRNVLLIEVDDPYDCCLGEPDPELMRVAALCDGAPTIITPTPLLKRRALGVKRAAADVRGIAGETLLQLIRQRRWDFFEALADEDKDMHRSARGMRRRASKASPLLEYAREHSY